MVFTPCNRLYNRLYLTHTHVVWYTFPYRVLNSSLTPSSRRHVCVADVGARAERRRVSLPGQLQAGRRGRCSGAEAGGTRLAARGAERSHSASVPRLPRLRTGRQQRGIRTSQPPAEIRRILRRRKQVSISFVTVHGTQLSLTYGLCIYKTVACTRVT